MQAADVMTTHVVFVAPETPVAEVARCLIERRISAVPVIRPDGGLVGIVSEGDLMRRAEMGTERHPARWLADDRARDYAKSHGPVARDVMTRDVVTATEETSLEDVATMLERYRIKRVPVVRAGSVVGIVSRADLLHGLVALQRGPSAPASDRRLRTLVMQAAAASGSDLLYVNVVVAAAVVELWGGVRSQAQKEAIGIAAASVPGVKAVEDHLWVLPEQVRGQLGSQ